jgi:pimeloyl-ACP methyl ester carboxylesterase
MRSVLALVALCFAVPAAAQPLEIAKQGWFYVGGHRTADGSAIVDQMYVSYQIPARQTSPFPVVMIHGTFQNGSNFEGTPDGRPGWAAWFVRHGYAVYVVDQPARGRSQYDQASDGPATMPSAVLVERQFTAPERFKLWPQAALHTQWPGTGMAGDPAFDQFQASQQATITDNAKMDTINRDAGVALLQRIGPAIILTHSRSGPFGWLIADAMPQAVKGIVAVEPNGPPFDDVVPVATDAPVPSRAWGIAYLPLTFDPPVTDPAQLAPQRQAQPDGPDLLACWVPATARKLPHLAGVPVAVVTSEASYHAPYDHCTVRFLQDAGVPADFLRLSEHGIHGNAHMMMLEKNSDDIAAAIGDWIGRRVH